ncbi:uncharacterized protein BDCG_02467 [Blastomyces dermatitidis ER-3]|uniref:Uncharacterized protein n=1 Tax=Ajellomyces dermatitidis (strain ER-3 / ATCC MYA-2586) TaxID=559297 RepID=A0ABP2ETY0_AJEDR|nr:uncharacterized protein BDCG_02467 [Blastomyces dermatitidis ER-3]EEQ87347.2 hypothetical protein BDCG_02467 [Blastomyces dermatitidis ER-3]
MSQQRVRDAFSHKSDGQVATEPTRPVHKLPSQIRGSRLNAQIGSLVGIPAISVLKLVVAAMLNRILVPTPFHRNMVWILSGPATLVGCICFPVLMTIGQPHQAIWDKLIKNAKCRDPLCSTLRSISSSMEQCLCSWIFTSQCTQLLCVGGLSFNFEENCCLRCTGTRFSSLRHCDCQMRSATNLETESRYYLRWEATNLKQLSRSNINLKNASDEDASPPLPSESGDERSLIRLDNDIVL